MLCKKHSILTAGRYTLALQLFKFPIIAFLFAITPGVWVIIRVPAVVNHFLPGV